MLTRASNSNQENEENKDNDDVSMYFNDDPTLYETPPPTPTRKNEEPETSTSAAISSTSASNVASVTVSRPIGLNHIPTQEEVFFGTSEPVPQLSDSGVGTSVAFDHSSDAFISVNPDLELRQEEAALQAVEYDYMFKKLLTRTDVGGRLHVPKPEAKRSFLSLQNTGQAFTDELRVYDLNRKQTMTWNLSSNQSGCFIGRSDSGKYTDGNNLQDKDSVLFYKRKNNQIINNDTLPLYAVQFERSGETLETGLLYIPLIDLENATQPPIPARSSDASISENPGSESWQEEAALQTVAYDYMFKKLLTRSDVSGRLFVQKLEAEKTFLSLQNTGQAFTDELRVYDLNKKQTMKWNLSSNKLGCFIRRSDSGKYIDGNNLQDKDSVLFYKRKNNQMINDTLPLYAVQIERSGETLQTGMLYIPLIDLENATPSPTPASECPAREVSSSQISDLGVIPSVSFNQSSGASIFEHPESEVRQIRSDEAALRRVTYYFIFKKQLDATDMSSTFHIPKEEAKRHFHFVRGSLQPVYARIYDCNRKQTLKWRLLCHRLEYFISTESNYVSGNILQPGDSVLFYRTTSNQMINDTPLPSYAIQFEKSSETVEMGCLCIPLNDLENAGKSEDS